LFISGLADPDIAARLIWVKEARRLTEKEEDCGELIQQHVPELLVPFLQPGVSTCLQLNATWALTNIASTK
jgi:hypothetical protein